MVKVNLIESPPCLQPQWRVELQLTRPIFINTHLGGMLGRQLSLNKSPAFQQSRRRKHITTVPATGGSLDVYCGAVWGLCSEEPPRQGDMRKPPSSPFSHTCVFSLETSMYRQPARAPRETEECRGEMEKGGGGKASDEAEQLLDPATIAASYCAEPDPRKSL